MDGLAKSAIGAIPTIPIRRDRILRLLTVLVFLAPLAAYFWLEVLRGIVAYLFLIYFYLNSSVTAFASLAAIVFAVGWYIPWWPMSARLRPWQQASIFLMAFVALHALWFLFGWVTFHPLCRIEVGFTDDNGQRALTGKLDPAYADLFEYALTSSWGTVAVQRTDANTILVRPALALINSEGSARISNRIAASPLPAQLAGRKNAECLAMEQNAMLGGKADSWRRGWGLWPWNTIDGDEGFARWLRGLYKTE